MKVSISQLGANQVGASTIVIPRQPQLVSNCISGQARLVKGEDLRVEGPSRYQTSFNLLSRYQRKAFHRKKGMNARYLDAARNILQCE